MKKFKYPSRYAGGTRPVYNGFCLPVPGGNALVLLSKRNGILSKKRFCFFDVEVEDGKWYNNNA